MEERVCGSSGAVCPGSSVKHPPPALRPSPCSALPPLPQPCVCLRLRVPFSSLSMSCVPVSLIWVLLSGLVSPRVSIAPSPPFASALRSLCL